MPKPSAEAVSENRSTVPAGRKLTTIAVLPGLIALLVMAILYSVTIGRYDLSIREVALILIENIHPLVVPYWDPVKEVVVEQVRLLRILAAVLIGLPLRFDSSSSSSKSIERIPSTVKMFAHIYNVLKATTRQSGDTVLKK